MIYGSARVARINGDEGIGWGTWIRTKINGVRVRCSTVELSPNGTEIGTRELQLSVPWVARCLAKLPPNDKPSLSS